MELNERQDAVDEDERLKTEIRDLQIQLQRIVDEYGKDEIEKIRQRALDGDKEAGEFFAGINAMTKRLEELGQIASQRIVARTADMDFGR
jgi:hypothetical protein